MTTQKKVRSTKRRNSGPLTRTEMVTMERPSNAPQGRELETLEDYREYNKEAREKGWRLKYPPASVHEHRKVKVMRLDGQGANWIRVKLLTLAHGMEIDYDDKIKPGEVYELPIPVIKHLESKVYPQYAERKNPDGTSETVYTHDEPRFAVSIVL